MVGNDRERSPYFKGGGSNLVEPLPLDGIRVLDFTRLGTGGMVTWCLACFGAEVIKIESGNNPDILRVTAPFVTSKPSLDSAAFFLEITSNKKSLGLNLKHPRGLELTRKLMLWADVVCENFAPGTLDRLGLGYSVLKEIRPDIILVSSSIQGQTGPHSEFAGYGHNTVGLSGITDLVGFPDKPPAGVQLPYADYTTPPLGVIAVLAALEYHRRTGKGQHIDITQYEATLHFLEVPLLDYFNNGNMQTRDGNRSPGEAPHGAFPCAGDDRWCVIAVHNDAEWRALCHAMGNPALAEDPLFSTILERKQNEDKLSGLIASWTMNFSPEEVVRRLRAVGIDCGVVRNGKDLVEDPQLNSRGAFQEVYGHRELQSYSMRPPPLKFAKSHFVAKAPPVFGEHTYEICRELLGLSEAEISQLLSEGALET